MRTRLMLLFLAIVLVILNYDIYKKEQIKAKGETVFLELDPSDPRSLMQGDYMRLRYVIENSATNNKQKSQNLRRGHIVINTDKNKKAQFARFYTQNDTFKSNEKLLRYHKAYHDRIKIVPNSFFFQEGHAQYYSKAKYGVFKFIGKKSYILTGLVDENFNLIVPEK